MAQTVARTVAQTVTQTVARTLARTDLMHDATLIAWTALAVARATGRGRPGLLDVVVVAGNLTAGTPAALARLRARRRDPVALLAPPAVAIAVLATALAPGRWPPVIAIAVLHALAAVERRRTER